MKQGTHMMAKKVKELREEVSLWISRNLNTAPTDYPAFHAAVLRTSKRMSGHCAMMIGFGKQVPAYLTGVKSNPLQSKKHCHIAASMDR
jgi:hypothetical protein